MKAMSRTPQSQESKEEETVVAAEVATQRLRLYDTGFPLSRE
jgi:hypothetical protein